MENSHHIYFEGLGRASPDLNQSNNACSSLGRETTAQHALGVKSSLDDGPLDPFMSWLLGRAGIDARTYRSRPFERRLQACLRLLGAPFGSAAKDLLEKRPELIERILDVALIGFSSFFRDKEVFQRLSHELQSVIRSSRGPLRVLSAGSSDGRELYSMAMLLDEACALDRSDLLGVDCRPMAVEQAREGCFDALQLSGIDQSRRERFLLQSGLSFKICPQLRQRTRWLQANLFAFGDPGPFDVILFRNVAIYLRAQAGNELFNCLGRKLAPRGLLITGKAEKPPEGLPLKLASPCIYRKDIG